MFVPGEGTGKFRLAKDELLTNETGSSISFEDYTIALVDEIEGPRNIRQSFTVGYWARMLGHILFVPGGGFPERCPPQSKYRDPVYLSRAVAHLRQSGAIIPDALLKHVSPLSWEHINLTGIYSWDAAPDMPNGFRPLRRRGKPSLAA
jgi:hypothetical protein